MVRKTLVVAALILAACTPGARFSAAELLLRKAQCAVAHQDLTPEQILVECAIDPKDAQNVLDIVGESKAAGARSGAAHCGDTGAK